MNISVNKQGFWELKGALLLLPLDFPSPSIFPACDLVSARQGWFPRLVSISGSDGTGG